MRERGERVRDCVWLQKGFGVRHKFDSWVKFLTALDRVILQGQSQHYQDGNQAYPKIDDGPCYNKI